MYLDDLSKMRNNLSQQYRSIIYNYKLLSCLNAAIELGNIGISESNILINLVFLKLMNNDISKLSHLELSLNNFIKKTIVNDKKIPISNNMLQLNDEIDMILKNISDALINNTIKKNYNNILSNNSIITIGKRQFNDFALKIIVPMYHHSTKDRPIVYNSIFYDNFITERKLNTLINNQIRHIYTLNEELLNNKLIKFYYLMCVAITFHNQYQNIIDIISKFIGTDIITINNDEQILNFYYTNKKAIMNEIEDNKDFYIENKEKINIYNEQYKDFYNENKNIIELVKIYNNFIFKYAKYIELF
jgi:hypothetical protein